MDEINSSKAGGSAGSKKKSITTLILLVVLIVGLVGIYLLLSNKGKIGFGGKTPVPTASQVSEKVIAPTAATKIGSKEISKAQFRKIEGGKIFYEENGEVISVALNKEGVTLNCTNQPLNSATVIDNTQIKRIKFYTPETIVGIIPQNETVIVFTTMVGDTLTAHTIAMKTASCPQ